MKLTKYEHACLVIEEQGKQLVIDPGHLSPSFVIPGNAVAIVITHVHQDHLDKDKVKAVASKNPGLKIFAPDQVVKELGDMPGLQAINDGVAVSAGPFNLEFYGTDHAVIHANRPVDKNSGVLVNGRLFYPGDSFTVPPKPVEVLALPTSGPWLKTGESIDYMLAVKPKMAFPTHNALLTETGAMFTNNWLSDFAKENGIEYKVVEPGGTLEI